MNKTGLVCAQRSCNHHHTYRFTLLAGFDEKCLKPLHSFLLFSEMQANPTSISAKPPPMWKHSAAREKCTTCSRCWWRCLVQASWEMQVLLLQEIRQEEKCSRCRSRAVVYWEGGWYLMLAPPSTTKIWSRLNSHLLRSARLTGAGASASGADEVVWCKRCCTCVLQFIVVSNSGSPTDFIWLIWVTTITTNNNLVGGGSSKKHHQHPDASSFDSKKSIRSRHTSLFCAPCLA